MTLIYQGIEIEINDSRTVQFATLVKGFRDIGASLRSIAKVFGMSKSALHRDLPMLLAIAEASKVSHTGHPEADHARNLEFF